MQGDTQFVIAVCVLPCNLFPLQFVETFMQMVPNAETFTGNTTHAWRISAQNHDGARAAKVHDDFVPYRSGL